MVGPESRNPSRRRETPKWCSNCARTKTSLLVSGLKNLAKGREIERTDIWAVTAGTSYVREGTMEKLRWSIHSGESGRLCEYCHNPPDGNPI